MTFAALIFALVVGTWNGNWFPSGRAEHRGDPETERDTIERAGAALRAGIDRLDPEHTNDVILCVNEVRGPRAGRELAKAIGIKGLELAVISGYRRRDRFDMQQDVVLTTLPVADSSWSLWKSRKGVVPPRGYARAALVVEPAVTATVYAVHLKSNYGDTTDAIKADNRAKRALAAEQLAAIEKPRRGHPADPVIIAGDFNTDPWREQFADETVFPALAAVGMRNLLAELPSARRWTFPNRRYGNSALDHVLVRGFEPVGTPVVQSSDAVSDHYAFLALVTCPARSASK